MKWFLSYASNYRYGDPITVGSCIVSEHPIEWINHRNELAESNPRNDQVFVLISFQPVADNFELDSAITGP